MRLKIVMLSMLLQFVAMAGLTASEIENYDSRAALAVQLIKDTYENNATGVSYLIAHKGNVLVSAGVGKANLEWNIPMTDQTVSRLGSISKPITAIAILKLVEQGKLELDQPVSKYIDKLPEPMQRVTLRQLLSHRSGIADHAFDKSLLPFIGQHMTRDKIIELQFGKTSQFELGAEYAYVNVNYVTASYLIENITKKFY